MREDPDPFTSELRDRLAEAHRSLSPAVESVVVDALEERPHSLSVTLARTTATAVSSGRDSTRASDRPLRTTLLDVGRALVSLEAYARIRSGLLAAETDIDFDSERTERGSDGTRDRERTNRDRDCPRDDQERDVAVLASDYLHASAHAALASVPVSAERHVELYRALTAGSTALATRFLEGSTTEAGTDSVELVWSESGTTRGLRSRPSPLATLAGTGCALGVAVAGASRETTETMRSYGESLVTATELVDGYGDSDSNSNSDPDPDSGSHDHSLLETVERVLVEESDDGAPIDERLDGRWVSNCDRTRGSTGPAGPVGPAESASEPPTEPGSDADVDASNDAVPETDATAGNSAARSDSTSETNDRRTTAVSHLERAHTCLETLAESSENLALTFDSDRSQPPFTPESEPADRAVGPPATVDFETDANTSALERLEVATRVPLVALEVPSWTRHRE